MRGYYGIGIELPKFEGNIGTLWRSAYNFNADFIFTIGARYKSQKTDTGKTWKHIPLFEYPDFKTFYAGFPRECSLVGVEFPHKKAEAIGHFHHPERAIYLLGAEDHGLSTDALKYVDKVVYIPTKHCINVSTAGSIIMFDRIQKTQNEN